MEINKQLYVMRPPQYREGLEDLIRYINERVPTKDIDMIEIGSYAGESTELFSKHFNKVIAIDPFINDYDIEDPTCKYRALTEVYDTFRQVLHRCPNISHIREISDNAMPFLQGVRVQFIYIDGLHTYQQIKKDIVNYLPFIDNHGFIGGHDYHPTWQGVVNGIKEVLGTPECTFKDTSWIRRVSQL